MTKLVIRVLINAAALWVAASLVDGVTLTETWWMILVVAVIFGAVNAVLKPIAKILSLPLIIVTLGLFTIIINTLLLYLVDFLVGDALEVSGFVNAIIASIIISLVSFVLSIFLTDDDD
jgi:putative membrane protein